jgi:hypothetical protein
MPSTIIDSLHPHRVRVSTTAMETIDGDADAMEDRLRAAVSLGEAFGLLDVIERQTRERQQMIQVCSLLMTS